jgi:hypothetical protein
VPSSIRAGILEQELALLHAETLARLAKLPLPEFIPAVTPNYQAPLHLRPLTDLLARIDAGEVVRACVHFPPRHGKTDTIGHWLARAWITRPVHVAYLTASQDLANSKSREFQNIALRTGLQLGDVAAVHEWWLTGGGRFVGRGIGGTIIGKGFHRIILDDVFPGRPEAESPTIREKMWQAVTGDVLPRLEPGASVIVPMQRWHMDDITGRLVERYGWEYIRVPAICDDERTDLLGRKLGEAMWPQRYTADYLRREVEALDPYKWASQYQGVPVPAGATLFRDTYFYDDLPTAGYRLAYGMDCAYTAKTTSDRSVLLECRITGRGNESRYHVTDVWKGRVDSRAFSGIVLRAKGQRLYWKHGGGAELGIADLLETMAGVRITRTQVRADKLAEAQAVAAAWNAGRVLLPRAAPWLHDFVGEVLNFTGRGDPHDDQVDALASVYDGTTNVPGAEYIRLAR